MKTWLGRDENDRGWRDDWKTLSMPSSGHQLQAVHGEPSRARTSGSIWQSLSFDGNDDQVTLNDRIGETSGWGVHARRNGNHSPLRWNTSCPLQDWNGQVCDWLAHRLQWQRFLTCEFDVDQQLASRHVSFWRMVGTSVTFDSGPQVYQQGEHGAKRLFTDTNNWGNAYFGSRNLNHGIFELPLSGKTH